MNNLNPVVEDNHEGHLNKTITERDSDNQNKMIDNNKSKNNSEKPTEKEDTVKQDNPVDVDNKSENRTEKLEQLDLSYLNGKRIENVKKQTKLEKKQEQANNRGFTDDSQLPTSERIQNVERHIKLMNGFEQFSLEDLVNEVASTEVVTKLVNLLDLFPKFRTAFSQKLKFQPKFKNAVTNAITLLGEHKVVKVNGKVENHDTEIFLDSCASVNMVTRSALNKYQVNKEPIGNITETIFQAYSNTSSTTDLYKLHITIGNKSFVDLFRVIEKDDIFDILIGVDSLKRNRFSLNFVDDSLYYIDPNNSYIKLAHLNYDINLPDNNKGNSDPTNINPDKDSENIVENDDYEQNCKSELPSQENVPMLLTISPSNQSANSIKNIGTKDSIIKNIIHSLPKKIKTTATNLFKKFKNVIAVKTDDLIKTKLLPHRINLMPKTNPIKLKPYRLSKIQSDALKQELTKLLNNRLIVPSHSPWAFPVVLVKKKNGDYRMCVDYRRLNECTIKDSYALPLIDDILFYVGRKSVLTTIDLFSGYHQVPMHPDDEDITCFTTMYGNYNFKVMPFGLCNAPATFQREMNRIFFKLIGECVFIYIDDLIVFSDTPEEHLKNLEQVFKVLEENGLRINIEKCHFFQTEVELLGHVLSKDGLKPVDSKVKVILNWLPPKNVSQLRSFLGAISYYRKFIDKFALYAKPLFKLLKKNVEFLWSSEAEEAFQLLKIKLVHAPILISPDFDKPFIIRTDASRSGIGGVILQIEEGIEKPLYFVSRTLNKSEENYSVTDLEGTAAYYCVRKFKHYIIGNKLETTLITDHKPLVGLINKSEPTNNKHLKWVTTFSIYKIKIKYEEGKKNVLADALSRLSGKEDEDDKDTYNKQLVNVIVDNPNKKNMDPETNNNNDQYKNIEEFINKKIIKIDGILYYKNNGSLRKIIEDTKQKFQLIEAAHNVGHEGIYKTYHRLRRDYYWSGMNNDIKLFIKCCPKCQMFKPSRLTNKNVETIPTKPELPFSRVGLDIVGPLPTTIHGNKYIIVLVDYLTKWVEAEPLKSIESDDVIWFLKQVFARHGVPQLLITDNGPQFGSDKTKAFLDLHDVYVHFVTTYHPESNGEVENRNKEIVKYLKLLGNQEDDWDDILPSALWALRTCKNEATKFSSFELLYGRKDIQPFELTINYQKRNKYESEEEYWLQKFILHHKWISEAINNIETANKLWSDRRKQMKRLKSDYKPGDLILVRVFNRRKLDPYFTGPLQIVKREMNTVTVCDPISGEIADRNIHLKNIIPYFSELQY